MRAVKYLMPGRVSIRDSFSESIESVFSPLTLFVWGACCVLGAVAGPFGTLEAMSWPIRSIFWLVVVSISIFVGYGSRAVALVVVGRERPARFDLVAIGTMTVCLSPIVWGVGQLVQVFYGAPAPAIQFIVVYVFLMSASVFLVRRLSPGLETQGRSEDVEAEPTPPEPRLKRRLSPDIQGSILRLTANGHYIDVVTTSGTQTLRMRFSDAIDEMDPIDGICLHRSHWVTCDAIEGTERQNAHKFYAVLVNGDKIPISRKYSSEFEKLFPG